MAANQGPLSRGKCARDLPGICSLVVGRSGSHTKLGGKKLLCFSTLVGGSGAVTPLLLVPDGLLPSRAQPPVTQPSLVVLCSTCAAPAPPAHTLSPRCSCAPRRGRSDCSLQSACSRGALSVRVA